jgi:hypothetical protein
MIVFLLTDNFTEFAMTMQRKDSPLGFDVPTAVTKKSTVFWDVIPCTLVEVE